jgi:hypothetical protein
MPKCSFEGVYNSNTADCKRAVLAALGAERKKSTSVSAGMARAVDRAFAVAWVRFRAVARVSSSVWYCAFSGTRGS